MQVEIETISLEVDEYMHRSAHNELNLRWSFLEATSAFYIALLVASVHEMSIPTAKTWSWRLHGALYSRNNVRVMDDNFGNALASFLVVCGIAITLFLLPRMLSTFPPTFRAVQAMVGLSSIIAYPLALLCEGFAHIFFLWLELLISIAILLCWQFRGWPSSTGLTICVLALHVALWTQFGKVELLIDSWFFLAPPWLRRFWGGDIAAEVYPMLGLFFGIMWGVLIRSMRLNNTIGNRTEKG